MAPSSSAKEDSSAAPSTAKDAVLVPSEAIPEGVQEVRGVEFNDHRGRDISAAELVDGMAGMGFQASALGDAVRIINEMVSIHFYPANYLSKLTTTISEPTATPPTPPKPPSS